jgi:HSP20 family molecular chaperone IbpA
LSFENDFNDDFEEFGLFNDKFMKKLREEIDAIFNEVKSGKLRGTWETKEINEPGVKGWISMGRYRSDHAFEPIDPPKPQRRRPMPETPFELPKNASKEMREPLTDIFEEGNAITIYVELPGEEKEDIQVKAGESSVGIKARNFCKKIALPNGNVAAERMTSEYKNGVLRITLPKKMLLRDEDVKKLKEV